MVNFFLPYLRCLSCWLLLSLVLVACAGMGDDVPTVIPLVTVPAEAESDSSPRPDGSGGLLPPTWTPMPTALPLSTPEVSGENAGTLPNFTNTITYTIQAGDTLGHISEQFDVALEELIRVNNLANPDIIEVGQQLLIPQP